MSEMEFELEDIKYLLAETLKKSISDYEQHLLDLRKRETEALAKNLKKNANGPYAEGMAMSEACQDCGKSKSLCKCMGKGELGEHIPVTTHEGARVSIPARHLSKLPKPAPSGSEKIQVQMSSGATKMHPTSELHTLKREATSFKQKVTKPSDPGKLPGDSESKLVGHKSTGSGGQIQKGKLGKDEFKPGGTVTGHSVAAKGPSKPPQGMALKPATETMRGQAPNVPPAGSRRAMFKDELVKQTMGGPPPAMGAKPPSGKAPGAAPALAKPPSIAKPPSMGKPPAMGAAPKPAGAGAVGAAKMAKPAMPASPVGKAELTKASPAAHKAVQGAMSSGMLSEGRPAKAAPPPVNPNRAPAKAAAPAQQLSPIKTQAPAKGSLGEGQSAVKDILATKGARLGMSVPPPSVKPNAPIPAMSSHAKPLALPGVRPALGAPADPKGNMISKKLHGSGPPEINPVAAPAAMQPKVGLLDRFKNAFSGGNKGQKELTPQQHSAVAAGKQKAMSGK